MAQAGIKTRDWFAVEATDDFAGGNRNIDVTGDVETSRSNQHASLTEAKPQGTNPKILLLSLAISSEGDVGNEVMGWATATFRKAVDAGRYTGVQILHDGDEVASVAVTQRPS